MSFSIKKLPPRDVLAHIVNKRSGNYFDDEINLYFDGVLPSGEVTQSYVDEHDRLTLDVAKQYTDEKIKDISSTKLYSELGNNTDGAVTQKFFTAQVTNLGDRVDDNSADIRAINEKLDKDVQLDTTVSSNASTVTLTKSIGNIGSVGYTNTDIALPVASSTQAGVMNTATYKTVQENSELIQSILQSAVAIDGLSASPTQEELTTAWKAATSETELINRASIYDSDNKKIWYYYANIAEWKEGSLDGGTITIEQATNTTLGIVKGSTEDGQVAIETDGSMSVNGYDALKTKVDNADTRTTNLPTQVVYKTSLPEYKASEVDLTLIVKDLHTGGDASLPLNIMGATETTAGVMTSEQVKSLASVITSVDNLSEEINNFEVDLSDYYTKTEVDQALTSKQDTLVSGTNIKTINGNNILGEGNVDIEPTILTETEFNNLWENS